MASFHGPVLGAFKSRLPVKVFRRCRCSCAWPVSNALNRAVRQGLVASDAVVIHDLQRWTIPTEDFIVSELVEMRIGQHCSVDLRLVKVSSDWKFEDEMCAFASGGADAHDERNDAVPAMIELSSENLVETKNLALMSTFLVWVCRVLVILAYQMLSPCRRICAPASSYRYTSRERRLGASKGCVDAHQQRSWTALCSCRATRSSG